jgi:hypothetical protein
MTGRDRVKNVSLAEVRRLGGQVKGSMADLVLRAEIPFQKAHLRRPRRTARGTSKLAYVGHSFHEKTQSSAFFLDYLRQHFEVDAVVDESWSGGPRPDLSFIDDTYVGVVFFQTWPSRRFREQVRNENLVFVPMYDSVVGLGYRQWRELRDFKLVNFSRTLHDRLRGWGFESMYIQYFPEPVGLTGGGPREVFFWQRVASLDVSVIAALFDGEEVRLHVHRAMDPRQPRAEVRKEDEARLGITYSDWFENRREMLDVVRGKGVFVAPRVYEGIGLSFLEAMSMGKAVVAVNNPTMNEYIRHMETGYLFDLERPQTIDLSGVHRVQENAYRHVCEGYRAWEAGKHRIIEFIRAG